MSKKVFNCVKYTTIGVQTILTATVPFWGLDTEMSAAAIATINTIGAAVVEVCEHWVKEDAE